ncbi:MAG TPA: acyl-ACP--UDP-N-acetylglucosamine O-acyltransferase [Candidatus Kapabacteria bacterium]|nr:acyl-ACP--UDP-N-acetylglucosamine O-acyltransferase [Candidatus Kapabacteria bacterium]
MIHATAVIHPKARLGAGVKVGAYAVVDEHVTLGDGCELGPHVYLTGWTKLGKNNRIHAGAVIGDVPQDLRYRGEETKVLIGDENVIREHVTIHRSNTVKEATEIGSKNLLMAHCHVGHNSRIGNSVIIANGTLIAGHVEIGDRVFISGNCVLHQFVRVGTLALMQGGAGISKDLPPFTIARENNGITGLNTIGLRRAGLSSEERLELRRLYHLLFRSGAKFRDALERAKREARTEHAKIMVEFLESGKRGFCADRARGRAESTEAAD